MTEEGDEYFGNSPKCWICDNIYADGDVKTKIHCHIFRKYRSSAYRDCNTNVKLNHKIPIVFQNLKNYDSHLLIYELGKFYFKINIISNRLEKYMRFKINNKLIFVDIFLSFPLVKNLSKDDFQYLSQEFDNNILYLVK